MVWLSSDLLLPKQTSRQRTTTSSNTASTGEDVKGPMITNKAGFLSQCLDFCQTYVMFGYGTTSRAKYTYWDGVCICLHRPNPKDMSTLACRSISMSLLEESLRGELSWASMARRLTMGQRKLDSPSVSGVNTQLSTPKQAS